MRALSVEAEPRTTVTSERRTDPHVVTSGHPQRPQQLRARRVICVFCSKEVQEQPKGVVTDSRTWQGRGQISGKSVALEALGVVTEGYQNADEHRIHQHVHQTSAQT